MPVFQSFEEAWQTFLSAGAVFTSEQWETEVARGRGQAIAFVVSLGDGDAAYDALAIQDEIAEIPGLNLVSEDSLHISVKLAGFQVIQRTFPDDILREEVPLIDEQATEMLRSVPPFRVRIGQPNAFPDAVILEVDDSGALRRLNAALMEHIPLLHRYPNDSPNYLPHVTIATFEDESGLPELKERLRELRVREVGPVEVRSIQLARIWFVGGSTETDPIKAYHLRP